MVSAKWIGIWRVCNMTRLFLRSVLFDDVSELDISTIVSLSMTTVYPVVTVARFMVCTKLSFKNSRWCWCLFSTWVDHFNRPAVILGDSHVRVSTVEQRARRIKSQTIVDQHPSLSRILSGFSNNLRSTRMAYEKRTVGDLQRLCNYWKMKRRSGLTRQARMLYPMTAPTVRTLAVVWK